jgi:4-hydroxy-tetrahydrodipicolinate synthase
MTRVFRANKRILRDNRINGLFVPLVTPLNARRNVDRKSVRRLVNRLKPDVDGFIPCLSTGEGRHLTTRQWTDMLEFALTEADGHLVVAGIEAHDTKKVIERIKIAAVFGVRIIAALPPFGDNVQQDVIYGHYSEIAATGVSVLVYNKSLMCGTAIAMETLLQICKMSNVVAVKEGSGDATFTRAVIDSVDGVAVLHAWEGMLTRVSGIDGAIIPLANLEPALCRRALDVLEIPFPVQMWSSRRPLDGPNEVVQLEVDALVAQWNLGADNPMWYADVKKELVRRGIISIDVLAR